MTRKSPAAVISELCGGTRGVFRGRNAVRHGVSRDQLRTLHHTGVITRVHRDTYRMTAVAPSDEQRLEAALLRAGEDSAAAGRSAGAVYGLEGVAHPRMPEISVAGGRRVRCEAVVVHRPTSDAARMVRRHRGFQVTGVEATLVALADVLPEEDLEIACEDARRRRLTSIPALHAYLRRFGVPGRNGTGKLRRLLQELDPKHPSRSTLEVKTRRLLVANGHRDFVREFPLEWSGSTHSFDFAFPRARVILETNGRRWHDDPNDYEDDHEKWSVPGRHGYRVVFATWAKVTRQPTEFVRELDATLSGASGGTRSRGSGA